MSGSLVSGFSTTLILSVAVAVGGTQTVTTRSAWPAVVEHLPPQEVMKVECQGAKERAGMPVDQVKNRVPPYRVEGSRRFFKAIRTVKRPSYLQRLRLIVELNVEDRLSEIQAPTLFIAGDKDLLIPSAREARAMAAQMPNAKVKIIRGAGHACLLGNLVRLADILAE